MTLIYRVNLGSLLFSYWSALLVSVSLAHAHPFDWVTHSRPRHLSTPKLVVATFLLLLVCLVSLFPSSLCELQIICTAIMLKTRSLELSLCAETVFTVSQCKLVTIKCILLKLRGSCCSLFTLTSSGDMHFSWTADWKTHVTWKMFEEVAGPKHCGQDFFSRSGLSASLEYGGVLIQKKK